MKRVSVLLALSLLLAPAGASAAVRVTVGGVSGSVGPMVESSIRAALKRDEVEVVSDDDWKEALEVVEGDESAAAAELQVAAIVEADTSRGAKGSWDAAIRVRSGSSGQALKTWKVTAKELKKLTASIEGGLWKELGGAISKAKVPKAPKESKLAAMKAEREREAREKAEAAEAAKREAAAKEEKAAADAAKKEEVEAAPAKRAIGPYAANEVPLEVALGLDFFARSYQYNDDVYGKLRPYSLSGAPAVDLKVAWYPGAHFTKGVGANIGLGLDAEYAFAIHSTDSSGARYPTTAASVAGSLLGRLPIGLAHEVDGSIGLGVQSFSVEQGDAATAPELPTVSYTFLRVGLGGRFAILDRLGLFGGLGYRIVLSSGDLTSAAWFPHATGGAMDGSIGLGYQLATGLEARLAFSLRHYFFSMNPVVGDMPYAGGAYDDYYGGSLSVAWQLGR